MQNRCELYISKPPLPEYLTTEDLNLVPPTSREAVLEMMKNVETDRSNGDNGEGASGMNPSAFEEPESSPDMEKTIPSTNLPHLKIPKVEQDAEDTSVAPPPEVPISVRDKAKISYVYSS